MAISTYKTFLMKKNGESSYVKLIDIKSFPDLGGAPEMLETTTMSDKMQTFIPGIQTLSAFDFTANYTLEDYQKVAQLAGTENDYAVWFGGSEGAGGEITPTGEFGKFAFKGQVFAFVNGGEVNSVVNMTVSVIPSTVITLDE